jgi:CubicO group peptidase (beta-lactamase class C family)
MQLVEAGKVDLKAPVTDYLPYFKLADTRYKNITVDQLISHRSGLPEVEDWFTMPVEYDDGVLERYMRSLDTVELLFAPRAQWSYSGMGYVLLAGIVEEVTGQTFEAYLQENIIDPLGMSDTMLIIPPGEESSVTGNHIKDENGQVVVSDIFPYRRQFAATGPLYSSITDMARYAAAHLHRGELDGVRILPALTYDAMWAPTSDTGIELYPTLFGNYGKGWFTGQLDGHPVVSHIGFDEGYGALMLLAPDDNVAIVMNSNYFDEEVFDLSVWDATVEVMRMLLAEGQ